MKDRKLIQLLLLFDTETAKRLSRFLASPYFNTLAKLRDLGDFFLQFHPDFDHPDLTDEEAYRALSPGKPYNSHELNRYTSKLYKLVEQFLEVEAVMAFPEVRHQLRSEHYFELQAESQFKQSQKQYTKHLENQSPPTSATLFYTYLSRKLSYNFWVQRKPGPNTDTLFREAFQALDAYYLIELLQASAIMQYRFKKAPETQAMPLLASSLGYLRENLSQQPALLQVWFLANELLAEPDNQEAYAELKGVFLKHQHAIPAMDARNVITFLRSAAHSQLKKDRKRNLEELFEWYLLEIREGWIYAGNTITNSELSNITTVALALGKVKWAREFLESSLPYMVPGSRHNLYQYNLARVEFGAGDYSSCLRHLSQVSYQDITMTLGVKRLELKAYFEMNEIEPFEAALNAFRVFCHRLQKKDLRLQQLHTSFGTIVNSLFRYRLKPGDEHMLNEIRETLDANPRMPDQEWITEKLASLKKK